MALFALRREENPQHNGADSLVWPNERPQRLRMIVIGSLVPCYFAASFLGLNGSSTAWKSTCPATDRSRTAFTLSTRATSVAFSNAFRNLTDLR